MFDLTNKTELLSYLKSHGLWAKHGLGQNFLVDKDTLGKIIQASELNCDDSVIEVGPGLGTLTTELVKQAGQVVAIEKDEKLSRLLNGSISQLLNDQAKQSIKLQIINDDILKVNIPELVDDRPYKVVANIPYYITSKILQLFLTQKNKPETVVMLVQKEVAERICGQPGDMSILALSVQSFGTPEIVDIVPRGSFFPSPDVDSAILKIADIHPFGEGEKEFFRLIHIGFASRRKTLANNIAAGFRIDKQKAADIINSIGLTETVRAQELSLEEWKRLVERIRNVE